MCNCNNKRTALAIANHSQVENNLPNNNLVKVKLMQQSPLEVYGDITGKKYSFEKNNAILWVDKRDVMRMRRLTGLQVLQ